MAKELYSERTGQPRALSDYSFMTLVWEQYLAMRAERFFGPALSGDVFLASGEEAALSERTLIRVFKVSGLRAQLRGNSKLPPGWEGDDVALLFDVMEYVHNELTPEDRRAEFRQRLNPDLALHAPPMEMLNSGQIVETLPGELDPVVSAPVADSVPKALADPFEHAIEQYRRRGASTQDKRAAITQLAGVLEPLRRDIDETFMPKDESDLFNIANNFAFRHNTSKQKRSYDELIWLDWMFYVYVATARVLFAILDRQELQERVHPEPDDNGGLPV